MVWRGGSGRCKINARVCKRSGGSNSSTLSRGTGADVGQCARLTTRAFISHIPESITRRCVGDARRVCRAHFRAVIMNMVTTHSFTNEQSDPSNTRLGLHAKMCVCTGARSADYARNDAALPPATSSEASDDVAHRGLHIGCEARMRRRARRR